MIDNEIRLQAVERFKTLDIEADTEFQDFVQMASDICNTPIALLTLLEEDIQWLKAKKGTDVEQMPVKTSFCTHTILQDDVMVVPDARRDERFADSPIVAGAPNVRFYAGTPLITSEGHRIGTLCVIDMEPHELTSNQQAMLKMLGKQAINIMEFRISIELLHQNKLEVEQHKEVIKKAEIRLRSFFESSLNFHVLLGKNGEVLDYNKVAYDFIKKLRGLKMTRGCIFTSLLSDEGVIKFNKYYQKALDDGKAYMEGSTNHVEHGLIYWEASFEAALDNNNETVGISYIIRDVTDRKIKEMKIMDQNKSLLKIAHVQSHEFRAPLASIIGMMDLIKAENYVAPREYYEMLGSAVNNFDKKIREIVTVIDTVVPANKTDVYSKAELLPVSAL